MDPLIITSNDSKVPPGQGEESKIIEECLAAAEAGASILHIHHVLHPYERGTFPDLNIDASVRVIDGIRKHTDAIIQSGITTATTESRVALTEAVQVDMMSITLSNNDRHKAIRPSKHRDRSEMIALAQHCLDHDIRPEWEIFHAGTVWNLLFLIREGLAKPPYWINLCLYHQGGTWSPPTPDEVDHRAKLFPEGSKWTLVSRCDPQEDPVTEPPTPTDHTRLMTHAILRGGHVHTGKEDRPDLKPGVPAQSNAQLVTLMRQISELLDRPIATPTEAKEMLNIARR